jgi:hypothetical protein
MKAGNLSLKNSLESFVIDEADMILFHGYGNDVRYVHDFPLLSLSLSLSLQLNVYIVVGFTALWSPVSSSHSL